MTYDPYSEAASAPTSDGMEKDGGRRPDLPLLAARNLSFGYSRDRTIFDNWSATFPARSVTAVTGPSGRGKSTLLYMMGLMLKPTDGHVVVDGVSTLGLNDTELARLRADEFGFVFQDAALDSTRTVLDNVLETALYRREPRRPLVERAMALLDRFEVRVPPDRTPGQVSGGQAQRIALCRALLNRPRILLADEPTGNLDPATSDIVVGALHEHSRSGAAVVVVTHDPAVASRCERVITL